MKKDYIPILLATALALIALLVSQTLWLRYASKKDVQEQTVSFQSCFDNSISEIVNTITGKSNEKTFYEIEPIDDDAFEEIKKEGKPIEIDAGSSVDGKNVSIMIENALIVLFVKNNSFQLSKLDTDITTHLNENGTVVSSHITLEDTKENRILDDIQKKHIETNSSFFIKSYTAERKIEIPNSSYLIKAEYRIKQPGYLKRMGIVTLVSFVTSLVIISVLFYLLLMLRRGYKELNNIARSFHGAIHDLKSPLAFVFLQLSLLEEDETNMTKKASLSLTADRVSFLTDKIMRLLKSAQNNDKVDESDKTEVSLYDLLEQIESEMHTMFPKKKISFKYQVNADFTMYVISDLIEASIRIIIENAVKFSGEAPVVVISAIQDVENIKISIADNGVGMSRRQMKNIFKPYFTTDTLQGNGIGLYYAQSIVKAHNGKISVKSEAGKGSEFVITLPNR